MRTKETDNMEENTENTGLELEMVHSTGLNGYQLKDYATLLCQVENLIKENSYFTKIEDEKDLRLLKGERMVLRKAKETIGKFRRQADKLIVGQLDTQCKDLESRLDEADGIHKKALDEFNARTKELTEGPKHYSVTIYTLDEATAKRVADYARKLKCEVVQNG